jgi:hypothetical protein
MAHCLFLSKLLPIMEAQKLKEDAKDILQHAGDYAETFYKLSLVRLTKKVSDVASGVVNSVLIFFISLCIILFLSLAAAWWLGAVLDSPAGGFLIVAGFYTLLVLVLILMRKKVISPFIRNTLISKIYEEKDKKL